MSLLAQHLEANGIVTLVIGSAVDIVEHCKVPRYLHTDFPLGNPCGLPYEKDMQREIMLQALALLEAAEKPNSMQRAPFSWKDEDWRADYARIDDSNRELLRQRGEQRRQQQAADREAGKTRAAMISDT